MRVRNDRVGSDQVINDRVRNDWVRNDRVRNDRGLEMIGSPLVYSNTINLIFLVKDKNKTFKHLKFLDTYCSLMKKCL